MSYSVSRSIHSLLLFLSKIWSKATTPQPYAEEREMLLAAMSHYNGVKCSGLGDIHSSTNEMQQRNNATQPIKNASDLYRTPVVLTAQPIGFAFFFFFFSPPF